MQRLLISAFKPLKFKDLANEMLFTLQLLSGLTPFF